MKDFHCSLPLPEFIFSTKNAKVDSVLYKSGIVIQDKLQIDGTPEFVLIKQVFIVENEILLGCKKLINLGFDDYYHAYKVDCATDYFIKLVNKRKLHYNSSYIFYGPNNSNFVMWINNKL